MELASIIILLITAVAAITSSWIGWLILQRQKSAEAPLVIVDHISISPAGSGAITMALTIVNRAASPQAIDSLIIYSPVGAKLMPTEAVQRDGKDWEDGVYRYDLIDHNALSNTLQINREIKAQGTQGTSMLIGSSDRYSISAILFPPLFKPFNTISMRVILTSKDADQRKITIPITRDVTHVISTSAD